MSRHPLSPHTADTSVGDRRRSQRYALTVPVTLDGTGGHVRGHTLTLSSHGALVQAAEVPRVEETFEAVLSLPAGDLRARVLVTRAEPEASRFTMEFVTTPENAHLLTELLSSAGARSKID